MAQQPLTDIPEAVACKIGVPLWPQTGDCSVEQSLIRSCCSAVKNTNDLFWSKTACLSIVEAEIAPPTMLSVWGRPDYWSPDCSGDGEESGRWALQSHFFLKQALGLPEAVIVENELCLGQPLQLGERVKLFELIRSISELKTTRLGFGRFWVIDVEYRTCADAFLGTETYTAFGYVKGYVKSCVKDRENAD